MSFNCEAGMGMTKNDQLLRIKNEYRRAHHNRPAKPRLMMEWAVRAGLFEVDIGKALTRAAEELAAAMRAETTKDGQGNDIRVNLAFETEEGWLWDQRDTITRPHFELNVAASRRIAYSEIRATVLSVNDYNASHPDEPPIQYSLRFDADLADDGIPTPSSSSELERLIAQPRPAPADPASPPVIGRPSSRPSGRV